MWWYYSLLQANWIGLWWIGLVFAGAYSQVFFSAIMVKNICQTFEVRTIAGVEPSFFLWYKGNQHRY